MKATTIKAIKALATDDYQKRNGAYPKSNKPDTINVYEFKSKVADGFRVTFDFKNTDEAAAKIVSKRVVTNAIAGIENHIHAIEADQAGDYTDDWVECTVTITKKRVAKK